MCGAEAAVCSEVEVTELKFWRGADASVGSKCWIVCEGVVVDCLGGMGGNVVNLSGWSAASFLTAEDICGMAGLGEFGGGATEVEVFASGTWSAASKGKMLVAVYDNRTDNRLEKQIEGAARRKHVAQGIFSGVNRSSLRLDVSSSTLENPRRC